MPEEVKKKKCLARCQRLKVEQREDAFCLVCATTGKVILRLDMPEVNCQHFSTRSDR